MASLVTDPLSAFGHLQSRIYAALCRATQISITIDPHGISLLRDLADLICELQRILDTLAAPIMAQWSPEQRIEAAELMTRCQTKIADILRQLTTSLDFGDLKPSYAPLIASLESHAEKFVGYTNALRSSEIVCLTQQEQERLARTLP
jgi:hypothetical protein